MPDVLRIIANECEGTAHGSMRAVVKSGLSNSTGPSLDCMFNHASID